ncbi:MAG: SH3 domain-containing protein, partial [Anaerolinea sp.]|nr:SH3 domain-containing protein [Anaerolinea sp.]
STEVVISQPTPFPTPTPPLPAPTPRPILPSARVQLDPGANLQLRQYPSSSALSLGLAPSGAILNVLGRQGEPLPPIGATPDPLATPFVDPASLLQPNQDLDPAVTWLFVEYPTPDGGLIEAWINALYVAVSSPQGTRQRLADLPTIPANRPGEAVNTAIQPPAGRQDVVNVTIINLDPGVNLNIRRTIGVDGEALARVPVGTRTLFRGISANGQWVFIRYTGPDGAQVDGWISATYAQFELNGRVTTVEELVERNLLTVVPDDTRGGTTSGPLVPAVPTVNPLRDAVVAEVVLDPGANLHLRRRANRDSESLALIPAGTQVIVNGRNEIGDWLQVTFEGIDGWVSTQYVFVTRNGRRVDIQTLPVVPEVTPTITPIGFTASPNPAATQPSAPAGSGFPTGVDDPNLDPVPGG